MCGITGPRAYVELTLSVSEEGDLRRGILGDPLIRDEVGTRVSTAGGGTVLIPPNTVDFVLPFGGVVKANFVHMVAYNNITYKLNNSDAMDLKIIPADTTGNPSSAAARYDQPGILLVAGTNVTSIKVSNPSSTVTAKVTLLVRGEG